jgi:SPP1 gp7 family putative phage head morphogenesis protein
MADELRPVFDRISDDATKRLKPLLDQMGARALDGFELNFADDVRKIMVSHMMDTYSMAKTAAADEIKQKAPANKPKSKDLITEHAQAIVDKQYGDMLFNLKTIVTDAVRKNLLDRNVQPGSTSMYTELSLGEVLANIAGMFTSFFEEKVEILTTSSLITTSINIGRDDVFQEYQDDIYAYQYSAILDDVVCPICEDLDGSVVKEAEYFATIWMPPIHFNCRCIWVAIMNDEEDKPPFTGLPDAPGGAVAPSLSRSSKGLSQRFVENVDFSLYLTRTSEGLWRKKRL